MKTFKFPQLKNLSREQGYKMACLEDEQGNRLQSFNNLQKKIDTQLNLLETRLKSDLYPDGLYYVCMAQSINKSSNPQKFPVIKGKYKPELTEGQPPVTQNNRRNDVIVHTHSQDVLSWEAALALQQEISDLKTQVNSLTFENEQLQIQIAELENEESEGNGMSEVGSNIKTFMSEAMPAVMPMLDRYFDLKEKQISLEEKRIGHASTTKTTTSAKKRVPIVPGSQNQINLIELLQKSGQEEQLNKELDRLEDFNYDLYVSTCKRLGIDIETEEEQEQEEPGEN